MKRTCAGWWAVLVLMLAAPVCAARAQTLPPTEPIPRIEAGMHDGSVKRIGVDPSCRLMITGSNDKTARLWALPEQGADAPKLLQVLRVPIGLGNDGKIYAVTLSPDGRFAAAGGWNRNGDNWVYVFDAATGKLIRRLGKLDNVIDHLTWSADDRYLAATLGYGQGLRVWETAGWSLVGDDRNYGGKDSYGAAFDATDRLYTVAYDGLLRRYGGPDFKLEGKSTTLGGKLPYSVAVHPTDRFRKYAAELVALAPDVILASTSGSVAALQQTTRTVPIVFVNVIDPVGAGFVASLARPGGNATGFTLFEYSLSGKWLELFREIAPNVTRIGILRDPAIAAGIGQFAVIQAMAPPSLEVSPIDERNGGEIVRDIAAFARAPNGGLIVTASQGAVANRELINMLAARHRLPAVYPFRYFVTSGGLISYGPNTNEQFRRAAGYVDRILKGQKAVDLPVQAPTKYELAINLKTAKGLGIVVPPTLLARADQVIE